MAFDLLEPRLGGDPDQPADQHQVYPGQRGYTRTGLKEINMWHVVVDEYDEYNFYSAPYLDGQNAPLAPVPAHVIQTGTSTDQVYKEYFQVLKFVDEKDHGYMTLENQKSEDHLKDYYTMNDDNDSDEDDLQEDFSPTAIPNDISVTKLTTSSFEPLQKSEKVEESKRESQSALDSIMFTESVIQTGDGANIVAVHDEAKEDEMNGGIVLDKMKKMVEGGTNEFSSTFDFTDKVTLAGLVPTMALVDHGDGSGPTLTPTLELHLVGQTKQM